MAKTLYHINPETGRPGECTATIKCKYSSDGQTVEHYESLDEALDAYENQNKDQTLPSLKKPEKLSEFSVQNDLFQEGLTVERSESGDAYLVEEKTKDSTNSTLSIDDDMGEETPKLSAPKAPPVEYQAAKAVEAIEPEKALTLVDDLSTAKASAMEKKSNDWAETITKLNPNSQEFEKHTKAINKIGNKAFR